MAHERGAFWRVQHEQLQIREVDDQARTIYGTVVPYGEVATVNDGAGPYRESFAPGAFTRSVEKQGARVPLFPQHNRKELPLARGAEWHEAATGLEGAFPLPRTNAGDDALELVRTGVIDAFSVGFRGIKARQEDGVTVRSEADLLEVSLVANPAYTGALIGGVRMADMDATEIEEWVRSLSDLDRAALEAALVVPASGTDNSPDSPSPAPGTADRESNLRQARAALAALTLKG